MRFLVSTDGTLIARPKAKRPTSSKLANVQALPVRRSAVATRDNKTRIYIIRSGSSRYFKIGWCLGDPTVRLGQLQVGNPCRLILMASYVIPPRSGKAYEQLLHKALGYHWIRGEWYRYNTQALLGLVDRIIREQLDHCSPEMRREIEETWV